MMKILGVSVLLLGTAAGPLWADRAFVKDGSRIEIKLPINPKDVVQALGSLNVEVNSALSRNIYFFDTRRGKLSHNNIILRMRRVETMGSDYGTGDSTVKIRPMITKSKEQETALRKLFVNREWDDIGTDKMLSGFITQQLDTKKVLEVFGREKDQPIRAFYNEGQRELVEIFHDKPLKDLHLVKLGPIHSFEWKIPVMNGLAEFTKNLDVELWNFPNGDQFLEISFKAPLEDVSACRRLLTSFARQNGLVPKPGLLKTKEVYRLLKAEL
jgi:hypothetical protein